MVIYITLADISPKTKTDDSAQPRNAQLSFLGERVGSGHKTKTANSAYTNKATHLPVCPLPLFLPHRTTRQQNNDISTASLLVYMGLH
jgi:hypothetical protein